MTSDTEALARALERFSDKADKLISRNSSGNATITVNAGGVGLWIAVTCCVVMLAALIPGALALYWVAMDSRDRGHQMNALYMSVPGLRELVDKQMKLDEKTKEEKKP